MKIRLFTLLATIFLLTNVTFGQSVGEYRVRKAEIITKKIEKPKVIRENNPDRRGFFIMPEIEVGGIVAHGLDGGYQYKINAIFGYEFNNHFALGVGTGFNSSRRFVLDEDQMNNLPFYINIHGDIFKAKTSLYYSLDLGFMLPLKKAYDFYYNDTIECYYRGLMISPEIGVRTNNCYFGINCLIANYENTWYYEDKYKDFIFGIKFGYKIPLNIGR